MNIIESYFLSILNRKPSGHEQESYKSVNKEILISELSNCTEKYQQLRNVSGERIKNRIEYTNEDIKDFFSTNKYKVALCISGHLRDYKKNLSSINKFLVEPLNADVFIHTWDSLGFQKQIVEGVVGPVPDETRKLSNDLDLYIKNIKALKVDNNQDYISTIESDLDKKEFYLYGQHIGGNYYGGSAEPKYIYSQLCSVFQSFNIMQNYSLTNDVEYDIVIKIRADYCLSSGIDVNDFSFIKNNENTIFVPTLPYSNHGHPSCCICKDFGKHENTNHVEDVCDVFAYSNFNNMKKYMSMYCNLEQIRLNMNKENADTLSGLRNNSVINYKNLNLVNIWNEKDYSINCFYPERMLKMYLKEDVIMPSKLSGEVLRG